MTVLTSNGTKPEADSKPPADAGPQSGADAETSVVSSRSGVKDWVIWTLALSAAVITSLVAVCSVILLVKIARHKSEIDVRFETRPYNEGVLNTGMHGRRPVFEPQTSVVEWLEVREQVWRLHVTNYSQDVLEYSIMHDMSRDLVAIRVVTPHGASCYLVEGGDLDVPSSADLEGYLDGLHGQVTLHLERATIHFYDAIRLPHGVGYDMGPHVSRMCRGTQIYALDSVRDEIVQELLSTNDVTYTDIYDWSSDLFHAYQAGDESLMRELLGQFSEVMGFLPDGNYRAEGPLGRAFLINIRNRQ